MKSHSRSVAPLGLGFAVLLLNLSLLQTNQAASWTTNGPMITPRDFATATLLTNGKVLVAGGVTNVPPGSIYTSSAELYDPATGT